MANNNFTELFQDGTALTQAQLETAYKSLTLDIGNTTQMTAGSTSGQFLKSNGDSVAASFASVPDPLGPNLIRNYGISAIASANQLVISLKTNAGADPSASDPVTIPFSTNGTTTATYTAINVTAATSITVPVSATLGSTSTSTRFVYIYAINNGGTANLAVSARSDFDQGQVFAVTHISGTSNDQNAVYSTATTSLYELRLLGWTLVAQDVSNNWQTPGVTNVTNLPPLNSTTQASFNRVSGTSVGVGGTAISLSSGNYQASSTAAVGITNLTVSITTTGRPVWIGLIPDGTANLSYVGVVNDGTTSNASGHIYLINGVSTVAAFTLRYSPTSSANSTSIDYPPGSIWFLDSPPSGTTVYTFQSGADAHNIMLVQFCKVIAYEI